jgi:hypothetical protein
MYTEFRNIFSMSGSLCFRWMLWFYQEIDDCGRLGVGMVAGYRCAASLLGGKMTCFDYQLCSRLLYSSFSDQKKSN